MNTFFFWNEWRKPERFIFYFLTVATFVALVLFWKSWWMAPAPVIRFDNYQQLEKIETVSRTFQVGTVNVSVPATSYIVFESLLGSALHPNVLASYLFLSACLFAFVGFITVVSSLSRFYFLGGMGLVILFISGLDLSTLLLFNLSGQTLTIASMLLFGGIGFYFNSFHTSASLTLRLLVFSFVTILWVGVIHFFSRVADPLLHLSVNGLLMAIAVSVVFIIMVSHEIVAGAIFIATGAKSSKSLLHFLSFTFFYLINVALLYASKTGLLSWSFLPINSFFLFTVSAILGVWGFRRFAAQKFSDGSVALLLYLSLLMVTLATFGCLAATASDMMLEAFEIIILAAHFGCGLIFLVYVIANFGPMLAKNMAVYKVLYKPETMPLFTFRIMSLIAVFATITAVASWKGYVDQATATYYSLRGDLYLSQDDAAKAENEYKRSIRFRNGNFHAHYGLAGIYNSRYESFNELKEYEKTIEYSPDPKAFINLNEIFVQQKKELNGNLMLNEGLKTFPQSAELKNALGLSFLGFKSADSALFYFQSALNEGTVNRIAETNLLGTQAFFRLALTDSNASSHAVDGRMVNRLAMANDQNQKINSEANITADTVLTVYRAAYYANWLVNHVDDTVLINHVSALAKKPVNEFFSEMLSVAIAHAYYDRGEVKKALKQMREISYRFPDAAYVNTLGIWLLEQNNPLVASAYFEKAIDKKMAAALLYQALAVTESDSLKKAYPMWDSLTRVKNKELTTLAVLMKNVLATDLKHTDQLSDEGKYYFCRYKIPMFDSALFAKTTGQIQNEKLRAKAFYDRAEKWFRWDEPTQAIRLLRATLNIGDSEEQKKSRALRLLIAASQHDVVFLKENAAWADALKPYEKAYTDAVLAQADGNNTLAQAKFNYIAEANDQFEEGLVAASRFFTQDSTYRLQRFSLLVDGLLAKPQSVKILKQYILQAALLGLEKEAQDALEKLQAILPEVLFKKFVKAHPGLFNEL
ncbi:MAG: hypothetical protein JST43_03210 [Bacteroidetes bacterium]|nr:hypothetical protein [Bacteroidota bacterium]MBS1540265.1 hypothetical protein [Bacteroidota bacterium]